MTGIILALALMVALVAAALRVYRRRRIMTAADELPGATAASAIDLGDIGDIDGALRARRCICGGILTSLGERSERDGTRVLRVIRTECGRCEREQSVYFDASMLYH